jgi:hypothetical protein
VLRIAETVGDLVMGMVGECVGDVNSDSVGIFVEVMLFVGGCVQAAIV